MQLEGKRIIVTGGSGGIGAEVLAVLTTQGATVTVMDVVDHPGRRYAQEAPGPGKASFSVVDITDRAQVEQVFNDAIEQKGTGLSHQHRWGPAPTHGGDRHR